MKSVGFYIITPYSVIKTLLFCFLYETDTLKRYFTVVFHNKGLLFIHKKHISLIRDHQHSAKSNILKIKNKAKTKTKDRQIV